MTPISKYGPDMAHGQFGKFSKINATKLMEIKSYT